LRSIRNTHYLDFAANLQTVTQNMSVR